MKTLSSAIYRGLVIHERIRPKRHKLRYKVFSMLLNIDELSDLDTQLPLFSYNRWGLFSFYDKDHGTTKGTPLRPWVEGHLDQAGIETSNIDIRLLCYPRILGYVFNPLSVYFCSQADGRLIAILYEVCNTYNERHTYVLPVDDVSPLVVKQSCPKALYVSPFMGMETIYEFQLSPPKKSISLIIRQKDQDGLLLSASFIGEHYPLSRYALLRCLFRYPLMTVKIIGGIHWEALRLWLKGLPVISHKPAVSPIGSSTLPTTSKEN